MFCACGGAPTFSTTIGLCGEAGGGAIVSAEAEAAFIKEISGLNDIPVGTKFNPDTQSFYSDLSDNPNLESDSSTL